MREGWLASEAMTCDVLIGADGTLRFVWDDDLAALLGEGSGSVRRVSHVEPTADGRWTADLGPVGGPILGPFGLRGDALAAERAWLDEYLAGGVHRGSGR